MIINNLSSRDSKVAQHQEDDCSAGGIDLAEQLSIFVGALQPPAPGHAGHRGPAATRWDDRIRIPQLLQLLRALYPLR
ncbi:hypothetical protein [Pseudomonas asiatica]|uniref:hypothetical protein n=1 Tax=Pseudomonas asiatica TaxID=2219225 RepID=UPI0010C04F52|nr:hypothetical protein [Pseudomonas asiatica]